MADPNYIDMFIKSYTTGYTQVPQEMKNPFEGTVDMTQLSGEYMAFDDIGVSTGKEKKTRFETITHGDNDFRRRFLFPRYFYPEPKLVDRQDNIAMQSDPTQAFIQSMVYFIERKKRDVIIEAMDAQVQGGKDPGDIKYTFNNTAIYNAAGRTIPHDATVDGDKGGTSTGLTEDKILLAQQKFADLGIPDGTPMYLACGFRQLRDLRRNAVLQSSDTSDIKALMNRQIRQLMGVNFVLTNAITLGSLNDIDSDTNVYKCWCWVKDGLKFASHLAPTFSIDKRIDMVGDAWQIKADFGCNAIRMHEDLVLCIECAAV